MWPWATAFLWYPFLPVKQDSDILTGRLEQCPAQRALSNPNESQQCDELTKTQLILVVPDQGRLLPLLDPFGSFWLHKHSTLDPSNSVICLCRWGPGTAELENPCTKLCYPKAPVKLIPPEGQAAAALVTWLLLQHGTVKLEPGFGGGARKVLWGPNWGTFNMVIIR